MLSESDQIIHDEIGIADSMSNTLSTLKLEPTETETNEFTLSETLDRYKDHQSIIKIRSQMNDEKNLFSLKPVAFIIIIIIIIVIIISVFFHEHSGITGLQGKGRAFV